MKENWTYKKLTDVCDIQYGYPFDSVCFSTSPDEGMPLIRIRDVKDGHTSTYYKGDYPKEYIIHKGDYLVGMDGEFNIAPWKSEDALLNQRVCKVASKREDVSMGFLYRFLIKELKKIEDETPFVTVKHLSAKRLNQVYLNIPSLPEQKHIVSELDLLQSIINKQQAQLKELDNLAQAIFYDMFGDPVENEKGWEKRKLEEVCISITDGDHMPPPKVDEGIPFLTISDIDKETRMLNFENTFHVPVDYYNSLKNERKARIGDLMYTVTGSYGIPVIVNTERSFCFQRHIALLRPEKKVLNISFLCYWALCKSVKSMADNVATGIAQKTVGLGSIRNFIIILPPLSLQQSFAAKIESIEKQKSTISQSIAETQKLFDYTMDKYFG